MLTAGTALKQSIDTINNEGGTVAGSLVALDREEILHGALARDIIRNDFSIDVMSIARISQLVEFFYLSDREEEATTIKNYLNNL